MDEPLLTSGLDSEKASGDNQVMGRRDDWPVAHSTGRSGRVWALASVGVVAGLLVVSLGLTDALTPDRTAALANVGGTGLGTPGPHATRRRPAGSGARPASAPPRGRTLAGHVATSGLVVSPVNETATWTVAARVGGRPAAWVAYHSHVALMRFEQGLTRLDLHAGSSDGGVGGWTYGDRIDAGEVHHLVAGFNGGFKLSYKDVGFVESGHVAVSLHYGLASIVTYSDGTTNIGAWRRGVPSSGKSVFSVLQNQYLLVDRGIAAANVSSCITGCWGGTIGLATSVPRSGLGINSYGQLIWAAGTSLTPAGLARALIAAGAVRAVELDINPDWVAGYLYVHHASGPSPMAVLPGQHGIAGELLAPDARDFLAVVAG